MGFLKHRSLLKLNLKLLFDYEFLRDGRYTNVASGQLAPDGSDMTVLLCDTSSDDVLANFSDGQVWQSPFRNWVYESGIVLNDDIGIRDLILPYRASGVYIGGTFKATLDTHESYDPAYAHHIDWINGRIVFDNVAYYLLLNIYVILSTHKSYNVGLTQMKFYCINPNS